MTPPRTPRGVNLAESAMRANKENATALVSTRRASRATAPASAVATAMAPSPVDTGNAQVNNELHAFFVARAQYQRQVSGLSHAFPLLSIDSFLRDSNPPPEVLLPTLLESSKRVIKLQDEWLSFYSQCSEFQARFPTFKKDLVNTTASLSSSTTTCSDWIRHARVSIDEHECYRSAWRDTHQLLEQNVLLFDELSVDLTFVRAPLRLEKEQTRRSERQLKDAEDRAAQLQTRVKDVNTKITVVQETDRVQRKNVAALQKELSDAVVATEELKRNYAQLK